MKLLIITFVFIFNQISFATEVIGDGYGADFNESLKNAKINAVAATWTIKLVKLVKKYGLKFTGF